MKLTFGTVKTACAKVLNLNASDSRVLEYVNRGCERLLYRAGKSMDTVVRYTVCLRDGCVTWPREIETIEAWASCGEPGTVRNQWFEFLDNGPGLMNANDGSRLQLVDRMNAVAFDDVVTTGNLLAVYADSVESTGLKLLVRYYDSNGNKVYTNIDGTWQEGEQITILPGTYAYSSRGVMAGGLYEVIKPVTKKPIWLYEFTKGTDLIGDDLGNIIGDEDGNPLGVLTGSGTYRALAYYEPDETLPTYRRSLIPCLAGNGTSTCSTQRITVMAKRRFIPAVNDDSVLIISHADAVRLACQAVKKEEDVGIAEAESYWMAAKQALNEQLAHWQGDGVVAPIRVERADLGAAAVFNMI